MIDLNLWIKKGEEIKGIKTNIYIKNNDKYNAEYVFTVGNVTYKRTYETGKKIESLIREIKNLL
jgi:hypothetical protein